MVLGASPLHQGAVARPLHEMADYAPRCLTRQPRSSKDTHYSKAETHERRSSNETQPSSRTHDESSWKPPHSPRASRQCAREHKKQAISKAATLDFNELSACDLGMLKECQDAQWRDDEGEAMKRFGDRLRAVGHAQAEKRGRSPCSEQQSIAAHEISSSQLERRRDSPKEVDPKRPKSSLGGAAVSSEQHLHQQSSAMDRATATAIPQLSVEFAFARRPAQSRSLLSFIPIGMSSPDPTPAAMVPSWSTAGMTPTGSTASHTQARATSARPASAMSHMSGSHSLSSLSGLIGPPGATNIVSDEASE